jgi:hypothetical protein
MHSLLHVSVHLDHLQGAYADPCLSYTFAELSVKYSVKSFALLGQQPCPYSKPDQSSLRPTIMLRFVLI